MTNADYFFLIFLGTIAVTRLLLVKKIKAPTIHGFRVRHYMYGLVLIVIAIIANNLTLYAAGFGLLIDEVTVIIAKGPGHKDEHWKGCEEYHTSWSVAGVLVLILLTFIFRDTISSLI